MHNAGVPTMSRIGRILIALVGLFVLGISTVFIGRSDTIAAFSDSLWGGAFFETADAEFDIETSVDGISFQSHPADGPDGPLDFSPAVSLVPGKTIYAGFFMRTGATSQAAQVEMQAASTTSAPLNAFVTFGTRLSESSRTNCADAFDGVGDTVLVPEGTALTSIPNPLPSWQLAEAGSTSVKLCFAFHLSPQAATQAPTGNGTSVHPTWTFNATPVSETP